MDYDLESGAPAQPAQPQTVEDWAMELATSRGQDTTSPEGQAKIKQAAAQVRAAMPGIPDAEIIAKVAPVTAKTLEAAKTLPPPPGQPGFDFEQYKAAVQKMQTDFGAESRMKVEQQARMNNLGNIVGRNLSAASRIAAGPGHQKVLDEQYQANVAAANQPIQDWQTRKAEALAGIEQQIKSGEVQQAQVKAQLANMGLEQALAERKDKATIAASEADPSSITSETYRHLADQFAPELRAKLGPKFDTLTAAQLKAQLPALEKQYLKKLEIEQKRAELEDKEKARVAAAAEKDADRAFRAGESQKDRDARIQAANIRASAAGKGSGGGAAGPTIKPDKALSLINSIEKGDVADKTTLASIVRSQELLNEAEAILAGPGAPKTGFITGSFFDTAIGKAMAGPQRQRITQITDDLANQLLSAAKGAQTEGDAQRMRAIVDMLKKDDPGPGIKAAKEALTRSEAVLSGAIAERQGKVAEVRKLGGLPSQGGATGPATISDKKAYDALPKGATYIDGRDGKTKVKG